ncbi:MAG: glycosyltransferase family 39 protein [Proteobacteria bacterium]|nr:glycosyltransferase family 39 protein [Pseudomonadota bacterium]
MVPTNWKSLFPGQKNNTLALILILGASLAIRLRGLDFLFPYFIVNDEGYMVNSALKILQTGDLDPGFFKYGGFTIYLTAALYFIYFKVVGWWGGPIEAMPFFYEDQNFILFMLGRIMCVGFGLLIIWTGYLLGKRVFGRGVGLLTAILLVLSPLQIDRSQVFNVDGIMTLFILLSVYFAFEIKERGGWKGYLGGGIFAGLALATKYNFVAIVPVLVGHYFRVGQDGKRFGQAVFDLRLWVSICLYLFIFAFFNPYFFLNLSHVLKEMVFFLGIHFKPQLSYLHSLIYQKYIFQLFLLFPAIFSPFLYLASWVGVGWLVREDKAKLVLLLSFPFSYFLVLGAISYASFYTHYFPLLPFVVLLGSYFFQQALKSRVLSFRIISGGLLVLSLLFYLSNFFFPQYRPLFDIHQDLGKWLEQSVKPDEKAILTGWFFPPSRSFWQGRYQRTARSSGFNDELIKSGGYDYIVVLAAETLEKDAGFFHSQEGWETSEKLREGRFNYRLAETINFPPWWQKGAELVFPLLRGYRFEIYRRMK